MVRRTVLVPGGGSGIRPSGKDDGSSWPAVRRVELSRVMDEDYRMDWMMGHACGEHERRGRRASGV